MRLIKWLHLFPSLQEMRSLTEQLKIQRADMERTRERENALKDQLSRMAGADKARMSGAPMDWEQLDKQSRIIYKQSEEMKHHE